MRDTPYFFDSRVSSIKKLAVPIADFGLRIGEYRRLSKIVKAEHKAHRA